MNKKSRGGDFSAVFGTTPIGTDDLGRPEYANEIYNPYSTIVDPTDPAKIIRNPYENNTIPGDQINQAAVAVLNKYYPHPNLNVAPGVLPNYAFDGNTSTQADQVGIRIDHQFNQSNTVFFRFNRSNNNGVPFVLEAPSAKVSKSLVRLAISVNGAHKKH